jgi:hypothetical protein
MELKYRIRYYRLLLSNPFVLVEREEEENNVMRFLLSTLFAFAFVCLLVNGNLQRITRHHEADMLRNCDTWTGYTAAPSEEKKSVYDDQCSNMLNGTCGCDYWRGQNLHLFCYRQTRTFIEPTGQCQNRDLGRGCGANAHFHLHLADKPGKLRKNYTEVDSFDSIMFKCPGKLSLHCGCKIQRFRRMGFSFSDCRESNDRTNAANRCCNTDSTKRLKCLAVHHLENAGLRTYTN